MEREEPPPETLASAHGDPRGETAFVQEWFAPLENLPASGTHTTTLRGWLEAMNDTGALKPVVKIKPPRFWWYAKESEGIDPGGINRIWNTRYSREKQLQTWASAPFDDFVAAGYGQWRESYTGSTYYQMRKEAGSA